MNLSNESDSMSTARVQPTELKRNNHQEMRSFPRQPTARKMSEEKQQRYPPPA
ncbi:hypothetical protein FRC02_012449 [Tulasnella sp. 418]|nr:hypothetical protein FRC02_012449 [Tulasnella sp. 418]